MSRMALADAADVRSNSSPSRADSSGNALIAIETASTAYAASNTCQPY